MIEGERYVDFNGKPLQLLGYVFCELQVNDSYIKKARILKARSGSKSIIGREWPTTLRYKLEPQKCEVKINSIERICELIAEIPELFKRQGKVNNYTKKINLKSEAKVSQHKGRRIPTQMQKAVDKEISRLLK